MNLCVVITFGSCHQAVIVTNPSAGTYIQSHYQWEGLLAIGNYLTRHRDVATLK